MLNQNKKITDFFTIKISKQKPKPIQNLQEKEKEYIFREDSEISGLYYIPNFLSSDENEEIIKYLHNYKKWQHVNKHSNTRRVIHYGYNYSYDRSGISKAKEIPKYFKNLVLKDKINNILKKKLLNQEMEQLIINEYKPGQGIFPHVDHQKYFGDNIVCLTVGSGTTIDFINKYDSSKKKSIYVDTGSLYIMSGDSRHKWKHGIRRTLYDNGIKRGTRFSLTYRTILISS